MDQYCSSEDINERVIDGVNAGFREFPYAVVITTAQESYEPSCAGSFISPRHILTAKHCVNSSTEYKIYWGGTCVDDKPEHYCSQEKMQLISAEFALFGKDVPVYGDIDLAIVQLKKPVVDNWWQDERFGLLCLPRFEDPIPPKITVQGWGLTRLADDQSVSFHLKTGQMGTTPRSDGDRHACESLTNNVITRFCLYPLPESPTTTTSNGDSGSAVVTKIVGGRYILQGILVAGTSHDATDAPTPDIEAAIHENIRQFLNDFYFLINDCASGIGPRPALQYSDTKIKLSSVQLWHTNNQFFHALEPFNPIETNEREDYITKCTAEHNNDNLKARKRRQVLDMNIRWPAVIVDETEVSFHFKMSS
ncbi:trypsin domain-containing protein [Ditylenchus destructor]|uniref:Trypsin domain-containing protein n=1 Tax=Ditylenchus destructor TaxID=166010 RepID=A0AAD4MMY3_9BILA|nr:trypsin domain-containing protein [Ditylenchus destructor]